MVIWNVCLVVPLAFCASSVTGHVPAVPLSNPRNENVAFPSPIDSLPAKPTPGGREDPGASEMAGVGVPKAVIVKS